MRTVILIAIAVALNLGAAVIYFTPKALSELKSAPGDEAEIVQMLKPGSLIEVRSIVADTLGKEWYLVRLSEGNITGYVPSSSLELLGDEEKGKLLLKSNSDDAKEKRRRLAELKKHPDWPRRIQSAVRNGTLCLKMTPDQLYASWEKPYQKTSGFILGFGEVKIFFYREAKPIAVVLKNDEVVGWSEKE